MGEQRQERHEQFASRVNADGIGRETFEVLSSIVQLSNEFRGCSGYGNVMTPIVIACMNGNIPSEFWISSVSARIAANGWEI